MEKISGSTDNACTDRYEPGENTNEAKLSLSVFQSSVLPDVTTQNINSSCRSKYP